MCGKTMVQCVVWIKNAHNVRLKNRSQVSAKISDSVTVDDQSVNGANINDRHTSLSHSEHGSNNQGGIITSKTTLQSKILQRWQEIATSVSLTLTTVQAYIESITKDTTQEKTLSWFTRFAMQFTENTTKSLESRG